MRRKIIIIIILLIVLFVIYKNKEKFTYGTLPENINSLPEDIKKNFDSSYFLNELFYINDNNYTLINKDISKYKFDLIYHDTNKQIVKGAITKIPSSQVYYFMSLGKITFKENDDIQFTLNLLKNRLNDMKDYLLQNGISMPHFIYMEFPYVKQNQYGVYGIIVIFNSGKILINLSDKYYYMNQLNQNIRDKTVFTNKYGSTTLINIIKNHKISDININYNELDEKKNPKNYKLIDFKIDKTNGVKNIDEIFEIV